MVSNGKGVGHGGGGYGGGQGGGGGRGGSYGRGGRGGGGRGGCHSGRGRSQGGSHGDGGCGSCLMKSYGVNGCGQNGCGEVDDISRRLSLGYGGRGRVDGVARSRLSQKSKIPVLNARKVWGTLKSSTCSTVVAVFKKFMSQSLVDCLTVKRKYITNSNGSVRRW